MTEKSLTFVLVEHSISGDMTSNYEERDFCKLIDIAVLKGQLVGLMKAWSILANGGNLKEEIKYIEQLLQNITNETS